VRSDFALSQKIDDMPLGHIMLGPSGGKSYPADDAASTKNVLTVRDVPEGPRQSIPRRQWSFAHSVEGKLAADSHFIHLDGGFLPGKIYEIVYEAKDPVVVGVGLAAVRDFLSYLKYDPQATAPVRRVYAVGISQSGRFLRHFCTRTSTRTSKAGRSWMASSPMWPARAGQFQSSLRAAFARRATNVQHLFPDGSLSLYRPSGKRP